MKKYIQHWYIPNEANQYRPYGMRHKTLHWITGFVLIAKVLVLTAFFILYPSEAYFSTITSTKIIELTNQERIEAGISGLTENSALTSAASKKLEDMLARNYFSHTSPEGTKVWEQITNAGYNYTYAGENLAMNFFSAEEVVDAWMKSKSHRENLLSDRYQDVGIAVGTGTINGQPVIVIVQLFGKTYLPRASLFGKSGSGVLGAVSGTPQVAGGNEEVTIRPKVWSLRTLIHTKEIFQALGAFILVGIFFLTLHERRAQHHKAIAHGLLVVGLIIAVLVVQPHFLEGIGGNLIVL